MKPEQVKPLDAAYLALDGPRTVGTVCLLLPLDGPVSLDTLRAQVDSRVDHLPELRRRLHSTPLPLDRPWWVDDAEFSVERHVVADDVGAGGLAATVCRLAMVPLDRRHPLWEVHLLRDGPDSAVLTKVHHTIADGSRYREILHTLFGTPPQPHRHWTPEPVPSPVDLVARGVWGLGSWAARSAWSATCAVAAHPGELPGAIGRLGLPSVPPTPFNRALGPHRSWAFGSWDLAASAGVRRRLEVTVNDVLHAATAAGLRAWLRDRDALTDQPLVALVPMSVRHLSEDPSGANRLAVSLCRIPTHLDDPVERLLDARAAMREAKTSPALGETSLDVVTRLLAPALQPLHALVTHTHALDYLRLPFNTVISNVPMGQDLFGVAGRLVTAVYPFPPLADGLGLNITVQGYQGTLDVGVSACADLVPDVAQLFALMTDAYAQACAIG